MSEILNEEVWTSDELLSEFQYRLEERLALLCGLDEPTAEQLALAMAEADAACEQLKNEK